MLDAQKKTYGPALNAKELHPYMWAVKDHYYSCALPFYNYPYAFGQLFSLALYANAKIEGQSFVPVYRRLLRESGREYPDTLSARARLDITKESFWDDGIKIIAMRNEQLGMRNEE
jgi:oligoendopeptidase F